MQKLEMLRRIDKSIHNLIIENLTIKSSTGLSVVPYYFNFLSGVITLTQLTGSTEFPDMNVLLIGDIHIQNEKYVCQIDGKKCNDSKCREYLPNFLDEIIRNTKGMVDIFFEFPYHKNDSEIYIYHYLEGTMLDTFNYFKKCLSVNKKSCKSQYPNLRLHYSDLRIYLKSNYKNTTIISKRIDVLSDAVKYWIYILNKHLKNPFKIPILQNNIISSHFKMIFQLPSSDDEMKILFDEIWNVPKIQKQLKNIIKKTLITKLYDFFWNRIRFYIKWGEESIMIIINIFRDIKERFVRYYDMIDSKEYLNSDNIMDFINDFKTLSDIFGNFRMIEMDLYLMSRLFKKMGGSHPQNVIIYTGDFHRETYRDFLAQNMNFQIEFDYTPRLQTISDNDMCINMPDKTQPFFIRPTVR